jgi:hypothetical protein
LAGKREDRTQQVMSRFEGGSFLIDRMGAEGVIEQDLAVVLFAHLWRYTPQWIPAVGIDRAVPRDRSSERASSHPRKQHCNGSIPGREILPFPDRTIPPN